MTVIIITIVIIDKCWKLSRALGGYFLTTLSIIIITVLQIRNLKLKELM